MCHTLRANCVPERSGNVFLPHNIIKCLWTKPSGQNGIMGTTTHVRMSMLTRIVLTAREVQSPIVVDFLSIIYC